MQEHTYTFHIQGLHCKACVILTEDEVKENDPRISKAVTSLKNNTLTVTGNFGEASPESIANSLTALLKKHGYNVSIEKTKHSVKWSEFTIAIPLVFLFIAFFIVLQKIGLVNLIDAQNVTYGTAFFVGVIASVSTCMAVVGGLLLSLSATFAKNKSSKTPHILFHISRVISFFVLGGIVGIIGAGFQLGQFGILLLNSFIGAVMLILGVNLLDVFQFTKNWQITMPKFFSRNIANTIKNENALMPVTVGIMTFFLPCGFTQSMQLYALSTGSFVQGSLIMLSFALGTLPVLSLVSFGSFRMQEKKTSGIFFKTAGLIVILFALFNIINGFVAMGLIQPIFNF